MKYDKIVGLKKQQEKENLEIIQGEIDAMLRRKERISITTLAKFTGQTNGRRCTVEAGGML